MNKDEVLKLAKLARIGIPESEAEALAAEFGAILNYVGDIKNAEVPAGSQGKEGFALRNVMREDASAHEPGIHTEALLAESPSRDGDYVKVKKIL